MIERSLYSRAEARRVDQVSCVLAGISGMQPVDVLTQCLVYQPLKSAEPTSKKGTIQQNNQAPRPTYHKLIRNVSAKENGWRLRIEQRPETQSPELITQAVQERDVSISELDRFRTGSEWYKLANQYISKGYRFTHGNIDIRMTRILVPKEAASEDPLEDSVSIENLRVFDKSGTSLVECCIKVEDGASTETSAKAKAELLAFAKLVNGAIDFRVPDRIALDPTVRGC